MSDLLKIKLTETVTLHHVDFKELDAWVSAEIGRPYSCVSDMGWQQDNQYRFDVTGELDKWNVKKWNDIKANKGVDMGFNLRVILNGLCKDGKLPAGSYVVDATW